MNLLPKSIRQRRAYRRKLVEWEKRIMAWVEGPGRMVDPHNPFYHVFGDSLNDAGMRRKRHLQRCAVRYANFCRRHHIRDMHKDGWPIWPVN